MSEAIAETSTLGLQIDALWDLREKKRTAEAVVDELKALIEAKEVVLMADLDAQGLVGSRGRKASINIERSVVPQADTSDPEAWDKFYAYVRRNNAFELLQKRVSAPAYREHAERRREKTVPGMVPFTKRTLSLRVNS